jgi:hypothetical protein
MEFNYKKYSLEQLDNWMHDAMSSADASPGEIYNCIADAVKENYYYYKDQTRRSYDLLVLLNNDPLKEEAEAAAEIEQDMKNAEKFISYEEVVPALNVICFQLRKHMIRMVT